jgi:hypothetical protein
MNVILIILGAIIYSFIALVTGGFAYLWDDTLELVLWGDKMPYVIIGFFWPLILVFLTIYKFGMIAFGLGEKLYDVYEDHKVPKIEEKEKTT